MVRMQEPGTNAVLTDDSTIAIAHRVGDATNARALRAHVARLVRAGFKMVECDVRRTSDGVLIVHHDAECAELPVVRHSYRELVERAPLVTLEEFRDIARGRIGVDFELKEGGYEAQVVDLLASVEPASFIVTSFIDDAISTVKSIAPSVRTGLLTGGLRSLRSPASLYSNALPFSRIASTGAEFLVADYRLFVGSGLAVRAKLRSAKVILWTVNDIPAYRTLAALPGVVGIITDLPDAP